jgi:hypothetical protein
MYKDIGVADMKQQKIEIGLGDAKKGYQRFIDAWHKAETGDLTDVVRAFTIIDGRFCTVIDGA